MSGINGFELFTLIMAGIIAVTLMVAVWRLAKAGGHVKIWGGLSVGWGNKK